MTWKYEPMGTKFERVLVLTAVVSVGLPIVACLVAESLAPQILLGSGFLYQIGALGMAAFELNKMDVQTFKGPGFMVRMGWRPGRPVTVGLSGSSTAIATDAGDLSVTHQDNSVEARLKRLESSVEALHKADNVLKEKLGKEVSDRKEADRALKTELRTELGSVAAQLKEATFGDPERLYAALLLGGVGTFFSTFNEAIGSWF